MAEDPAQNSFELDSPVAKIRARGRDPILIISIVAYSILALMLYQHMQETKEAIQRMTAAIEAGIKVQRFTTCIIATKEDERELQYNSPNSFCNRNSN
jgi:hypothetical protein